MQIKDRLIVALDVPEKEQAFELVDMLHDCCGMFKIGLEPFCNFGPSFVEDIRQRGGKVFLDLKFHDIPRTVAQAGRAAARLGVEMFNVHIAGGREMMKAVVEAVREETMGKKNTKILGVTVLTSLGAEELYERNVPMIISRIFMTNPYQSSRENLISPDATVITGHPRNTQPSKGEFLPKEIKSFTLTGCCK